MTEVSSQTNLSAEQQSISTPSTLPTSPSGSNLNLEMTESSKAMADQKATLTPSRTAYLPLVSPSVEEDGLLTERNSLKRSREEMTESRKTEGSAASYFNIKKQDQPKGIEVVAANQISDSAIESDEDEEEETDAPSTKRARIPLVSLPDEIGNPLMRAIAQSMNVDHSNVRNGESSFPIQQATRQHRAMSVPRNMRSKIHPVTALMIANRRPSAANQTSTDPTSERQRRNSVRAQQLSLLASQARLALSGTSNVNTAIRTENAVKGAMMKALNDVQARKHRESNSGLITSNTASSNSSPPSSATQGERKVSISSAKEFNKEVSDEQKGSSVSPLPVETLRDPTATWSEALQDPKTATSFLNSAKEVARDWANGFYAYEKEWIGSALQREQIKLEEEDVQQKDSRNEVGRRTSLSAPPPSAKEESRTVTDKDLVVPVVGTLEMPEDVSPNYVSSREKPIEQSNLVQTRPIEFNVGGGKLVDVLSNFATLIDSHKEGCHSLEKLANNARRLSAVQLPSVRFDTSAISTTNTATTTATMGSMSAVSSDAGSPMNVAGLMS